MTIKSLKYLSVAMLFAVSGCTYNQYTTTRGGYDDLYGGRYDDAGVVADSRSAQRVEENGNPDYQGNTQSEDVVDQYYDEDYITARNIQRNNSNQVGYNAGFADGYYAGRNRGFYNGMNSMWGYPGFNIGFGMGMGSMIRFGYSPWGMSRWNRWGSFYDPYWNSMAGGWGDPFMYGGGFGYPYYGSYFGNPFYSGFGYGSMMMMGYNPYRWSNYYPMVVNNHYGDNSVRGRNYGPRTTGNSVSRTAASGTRRDVGAAPTPSRTGARTSVGRTASGNEGYYARPRTATSSSARVGAASSSNRASGARTSSAPSGNYYYANPNSNRSSSYGTSSSARTRSGAVYRSSEGSRSTSPSTRSYGTPSRSGSYSTPSRSNSGYGTPSRSYSAPSRSYSAPSSTPSRSYSAPSAPSRSYSAPSGGGGGRSSSGGGRGPR